MADNKQVENDEEIQTKSKAKLLLVIGIVIALIVAIGCYAGAAKVFELWPFEPLGPSAEEIAAQKVQQEQEQRLLQKESYIPFEQTFTFTIKSEKRLHTGQIQVVLSVIGEQNEELAKKHLPLLNSVVFDKLSSQTYESLLMPSGRQRLKRELLDATRAKMTEVAKAPVINQILFTNFVLQ